ALADISRARAAPRRARAAHWLHARRATAHHGASVLRLVGLSDDRLLCTNKSLRCAAGLQILCRLFTPARHRGHPRLGAIALSQRRAWSCLLRWHALVRARGSAPGLPPGLEELHLQLWQERSA